MRRGELFSIRIDQIDFGDDPIVWVRRNQDDPSDSRRYQPSAKTKERPLPLPDALAVQINRYIMQVRSKIGPARRHPYLIVSHKRGSKWGSPLSMSAIYSRIFSQIRRVDSEFAKIRPHSFRHHFNYELSAAIDRHNSNIRPEAPLAGEHHISEAKEIQVRTFLNGHRNTASGEVYNQRHVRETSDTVARGMQSELIRRGDGTTERKD